MFTLYLLRHAKAEEHSDAGDHERVLVDRGREAAGLIGRVLAGLEEQPQLVFSSTAVRALETARIIRDAWSADAPLERLRALYLAGPEVLLEQIHAIPSEYRSAIIVGHQPGLSLLIGQLTGAEPDFPTTALARLDFQIEEWSAVAPRSASLAWLVTPEVLATVSSRR
jgi:phosphohistidine phosphatase